MPVSTHGPQTIHIAVSTQHVRIVLTLLQQSLSRFCRADLLEIQPETQAQLKQEKKENEYSYINMQFTQYEVGSK